MVVFECDFFVGVVFRESNRLYVIRWGLFMFEKFGGRINGYYQLADLDLHERQCNCYVELCQCSALGVVSGYSTLCILSPR